MPSLSLHEQRRSTLIRRRSRRAAAWGLFFLIVASPFAYRIFAG